MVVVVFLKRDTRGVIENKAFRNRWDMNQIFHTNKHKVIAGDIVFNFLIVLYIYTNSLRPALFKNLFHFTLREIRENRNCNASDICDTKIHHHPRWA